MSYPFGSIVLTRFPFTDLSGGKLRPALVISQNNDRRTDIVLAFITSNPQTANSSDALSIPPTAKNGLKVRSYVRFDKLVTLEANVTAGKLGDAERDFLVSARQTFFGVFGFGSP